MKDRLENGAALLISNKAALFVVVVALVAVSTAVAGGLVGPFMGSDSAQPSPAADDNPDEETASGTNATETDQGEMHIRVNGSATPGDALTITATDGDGSPVSDAEVVVNGERIDMTDEDGHAEIVVPDEDELTLEVHANGTNIGSEINVDVNQAADADAEVDSEVDIEIEADSDGTSQSTNISTSQSTSTNTTTSQSTTSQSTSTSSQSTSTSSESTRTSQSSN